VSDTWGLAKVVRKVEFKLLHFIRSRSCLSFCSKSSGICRSKSPLSATILFSSIAAKYYDRLGRRHHGVPIAWKPDASQSARLPYAPRARSGDRPVLPRAKLFSPGPRSLHQQADKQIFVSSVLRPVLIRRRGALGYVPDCRLTVNIGHAIIRVL
jgi:hypothetical protein